MTFIVFFALIALIYYFSCENKKLKNFLTQILNEKIYKNKINKNVTNHPNHSDKKGPTTILSKHLSNKLATIHSKNLDKKELTIRRRKTDKKPLTINAKKFNDDDKIERKKRAYSTHRKIGHTLKINNIHNDNKDINIKANKNKLKVFSSHQINKII